MHISSPAFEHGGAIPRKYTCNGEDLSPPLVWSQVPPSSRALVLIVDDPDVPSWVREDQLWVHWVVYNIDPKSNHMAEGTVENGLQGQNTEGRLGYMGPCPPDREHRYFFKLYALAAPLKLSKGATKQEVEQAMRGQILAEAVLMGRYSQSN